MTRISFASKRSTFILVGGGGGTVSFPTVAVIGADGQNSSCLKGGCGHHLAVMRDCASESSGFGKFLGQGYLNGCDRGAIGRTNHRNCQYEFCRVISEDYLPTGNVLL